MFRGKAKKFAKQLERTRKEQPSIESVRGRSGSFMNRRPMGRNAVQNNGKACYVCSVNHLMRDCPNNQNRISQNRENRLSRGRGSYRGRGGNQRSYYAPQSNRNEQSSQHR